MATEETLLSRPGALVLLTGAPTVKLKAPTVPLLMSVTTPLLPPTARSAELALASGPAAMDVGFCSPVGVVVPTATAVEAPNVPSPLPGRKSTLKFVPAAAPSTTARSVLPSLLKSPTAIPTGSVAPET